jgi:hydroxymethylglutaryl-CoA reductase
MRKSSLMSGFYKLTPQQRLSLVKEFADLTDEETALLQNTGSLPLEMADRMIENVIGAFTLPLGVATNFLINSHDYLIPMVIEEPSVVANHDWPNTSRERQRSQRCKNAHLAIKR